jgi:thymidylate synthase (FAD)
MKAELYDYMGTDLSVVNAARVSFSKESDWNYTTVERVNTAGNVSDEVELSLSEKDAKLINYLAKHDHWTPFAHTSITLRMEAPIPIRTQCFKHKIGMVENEESRRYVSHTPNVFQPVFREQASNKKQGSGGEMEGQQAISARAIYEASTEMAINSYEALLELGVAEEQARFVLPQGAQVEWFWTGNLVSFANFYKKRTDPNAQKEIRDLAYMVSDQIKDLFPVSWAALTGE